VLASLPATHMVRSERSLSASKSEFNMVYFSMADTEYILCSVEYIMYTDTTKDINYNPSGILYIDIYLCSIHFKRNYWYAHLFQMS
jgi:hypothetical protein